MKDAAPNVFGEKTLIKRNTYLFFAIRFGDKATLLLNCCMRALVSFYVRTGNK